MKRFLLIQMILLIALFSHSLGQDKTKISGTITDHNNAPLPFVNVFFKDSFEGVVSDSTGYFEFNTSLTGGQVLVAMFMGYETWERRVTLGQGETVSFAIKMEPTVLETEGTSVTASAFTSGDEKGVTLRSMDVLTTPGAAGDIYQAIQTYPGVSRLDEGSGLFVRGGDFTETVSILDQATVVHPYRWESPTGGVFGTIAPFLVSGTFFSSGGFSAKYGNALSAVLAMESLGMPEQNLYNFNAGLAGVSAGAARVLVPGKLGVRFSGNYIATDLMFRINQSKEEFTVLPSTTDGNLGLTYKYSATGQLKFFTFGSRDKVGVRLDQPSFDGVFTGGGQNQLYNMQWSELPAKNWLARTSLSLNQFKSDMALGILDLSQWDTTYKLRTDHEVRLNRKMHWNFGAEVEYTVNRFEGVVPVYDLLLDPNAEFHEIDAKFGARRTGFYAESIYNLGRNLALNIGLRGDHHNLAEKLVWDPRASLMYSLSKNNSVRASWGVFHQFATPFQYAPGPGNPNLEAMKAQHVILGYDYQKDRYQIRFEAYYKDYDDLLIKDVDNGYVNKGYGYASGADLFFKFGELFRDPLNGWISYSLMQTKRYQAQKAVFAVSEDAVTEGYHYEYAPSSYDITHNLTVVTKVNLSAQLNAGATWRIATGRPITPVVDAVKDPLFDYYHPIEGDVNSERLPAYHRVDISGTYYIPLKGSNYIVFYAGLSNLLNRKNVLDYDYSIDYSSRKPRTTNFSRFIYFGCTMSFQSAGLF